MTLSIMTFSIRTLGITTLSITTFSITTLLHNDIHFTDTWHNNKYMTKHKQHTVKHLSAFVH